MMTDYDNIAQEYFRFRSSDAGAVEKLTAGSGIHQGSKVLEIGCGTGNYVFDIESRIGCQCVGIDPSSGDAYPGKRTLQKNLGDAEHLCFRDSSFDLVFSVDVIYHVADRRAYFKEAYRVLKYGGILATLTDSEDTIRRRKPLAFYFPDTIEQELKRYPTPSHLKSLSEEAGLSVVGEDIVETPFELTDIEKYEREASPVSG